MQLYPFVTQKNCPFFPTGDNMTILEQKKLQHTPSSHKITVRKINSKI